LIIVAFLLPLALYFLALSWVNRQPRPVVVAGTWDFVGLLFAASGFLLVGGPAILSSVNDRWRTLWLLGESSSLPSGLDGYREVWMLFAVAYFLVIVVGSGIVLARRRRLTCVYNVEPADVEAALDDACRRLGIVPIRSGDLYLFGFSSDPLTSPMPRPRPDEPNAILEVESSPAMKHVSLRWEPHDSPLRAALEADLRERLGRTAAPDHEVSAWCNLVGTALLVFSLFVLVVLVARNFLMR
jgi:hypothetical protein